MQRVFRAGDVFVFGWEHHCRYQCDKNLFRWWCRAGRNLRTDRLSLMPYVPLELPPGIYRNGTEYESKGRWADCDLMRFYEGVVRPWGGWRIKTETPMTG